MMGYNIIKLIGKTIKHIELRGIKDCDDNPYLDITFNDNTKITIISYYGSFTGKSDGEYPCFIGVIDYIETKGADDGFI